MPAIWVLNGRNGEWIRYVQRSTLENPADRIAVGEISFARAAFEDPGPRPTKDPLRPARWRVRLRDDVLGEAEPPSGSQHAANLGEDGVRVTHAAQDEAGDHGIGAGVGQVDPFADDAADLEVDAV